MRIDIEKIWKILAKKNCQLLVIKNPYYLAISTSQWSMAVNLKELWPMITDKFKRSPLTQGGLEIVCTVEAPWESRVGMEKLKDRLKDYSAGCSVKGLSRNELSIFWPFSNFPPSYLSQNSAFSKPPSLPYLSSAFTSKIHSLKISPEANILRIM